MTRLTEQLIKRKSGLKNDWRTSFKHKKPLKKPVMYKNSVGDNNPYKQKAERANGFTL